MVDSRKELKIIFEHFEKYPIHESKQRAFLAIKLVTERLDNKDHYDKDKLA